MALQRKRFFSLSHAIAWVVSLALGIGWVVFLGALPDELDPVVTLFLALVGLFGFGFGLLIATGTLVRGLSLFGTRPGSLSPPTGHVPSDTVFGICILLFALPSLFVYYGC